MDNVQVASELVKLAKELVAMDARRRANYDLSYEVVDAFEKVRGIESVGTSDGFNDETTFTISLEMEAATEDYNRKDSPYRAPSSFVIPLRSIAGIIRRTLKRVSLEATSEDGREATVRPVLDGKVFVPSVRVWKDEYGEKHKVYNDSRVSFDIYMEWNWK